jgi:hypothetical protein
MPMLRHISRYLSIGASDSLSNVVAFIIFVVPAIVLETPMWIYLFAAFGMLLLRPLISLLLNHLWPRHIDR